MLQKCCAYSGGDLVLKQFTCRVWVFFSFSNICLGSGSSARRPVPASRSHHTAAADCLNPRKQSPRQYTGQNFSSSWTHSFHLYGSSLCSIVVFPPFLFSLLFRELRVCLMFQRGVWETFVINNNTCTVKESRISQCHRSADYTDKQHFHSDVVLV